MVSPLSGTLYSPKQESLNLQLNRRFALHKPPKRNGSYRRYEQSEPNFEDLESKYRGNNGGAKLPTMAKKLQSIRNMAMLDSKGMSPWFK